VCVVWDRVEYFGAEAVRGRRRAFEDTRWLTGMLKGQFAKSAKLKTGDSRELGDLGIQRSMQRMTEKDYFDFAYEEYKSELQMAYSLPQRVGILLTAEVVIGGAAAALIRIDLLPRFSERWDILGLHVVSVLVMGCLLVSVGFLFTSALPRDYPKLNKLFFWSRWREEYQRLLSEDDPDAHDRNRDALAEATLGALLDKLSDAQSTAAYANQKRLAAFHKSVFWMAVAAIGLIMQGFVALVLKMNGV